MTIEQRVRACLLIEKMQAHKSCSDRLGLEDRSRFHGRRIGGEEERETC